jgi:hypothetical protein
MSTKLRQIKQRLHIPDKQAEPVAEQQEDDSGLAAAISALVQREVEKQTAVAKQPARDRLQEVGRQVADTPVPEHLKEFGARPSNTWPAPTKTTPFPKAPITVSIMRDAAGKAIGATVGDKQFKIERNGAGRAMKLCEVT